MLELQNICYKVYDKENDCDKVILQNFSGVFEKNKITAITGVNGSGKSTLIKIIMGIEKPTSGKILYNNQDITNLSVTERANLGATIAFQQPVKFKGLTVKDLLDVACSKQTKLSDACDYLSAVGLCAKNYLNREINNTLSGGELKRIELAIALAKGGDLFLFDEPEAGIDLWSFDELIGIFKKLKDKTVIIVSHQNKILEISDTIVLFDGKNYIFGKSKQIINKVPNVKCSKLSEVQSE